MSYLTSHFGHFSVKTILLTVSFALLSACSGAGDDTPAPKSNEPNTQQKPKPNKPNTKPSKPKPSDTDTTAPSISSINPADNAALGSASNKKPSIEVRFSENVQNVNNTNVLLKQGANPVAVTITGSGAAYSITPNADLVSNQPYTLELKAGIKDAAGNALAAVSKSYNTADWVIPTISSLSPADGASIGSASNKKPSIEVRFSENVQNVNNTNVLLKQGTNPVAVTITGSGAAYSITPNADLVSNQPYTLELKAGIKDAAGNALVAVSKSYNTPDWAIPTISNLTPADGATIGTANDKRPAIRVTFSENVQNVNATNVVLKQGTTPVAVTITGSGATYSIAPNADLVSSGSYTLEFKAGITDTAGNALVAVSKSYTTDWVIPTISSLTPANNATDVSVKPSISLNFSEAVTGVNTANVLLSKSNDGSNPVVLTASGSGSSYSFTLNSKLDYDTEYFIVIKAANIKDAANNALGSANQVTSFRTYKQTVSFNAWVGTNNTLLDINGSLPNNSELYSYRDANYNDCNIASITSCTHGQTLLLNGQTITNPAHTLANAAFYKLKEGSFTSTGSSENAARFSARNNHQVVWFKNKLWVIGGLGGGSKNDVWSSNDGVNWTQATANAGFTARFGHQVVVANIDGSEKLWLIGGNDGNNKNDVWSSSDGVNWTEVRAPAGTNRFTGRFGHQVVVSNIGGSEKLWVIGGSGDGGNKNDVWHSVDGVNWTVLPALASQYRFSPRFGHQVVVRTYNRSQEFWLIGGDDGRPKNDVWYSTDGGVWRQAPNTNTGFLARYDHQLVVANIDGSEKLWLIGGHSGSYRNDVWSSADGFHWTQATASAGFSGRFDHQVVVSNIGGSEKLWLIGGYGGGFKNDVWRSEDGATWRKAYLGEITRP